MKIIEGTRGGNHVIEYGEYENITTVYSVTDLQELLAKAIPEMVKNYSIAKIHCNNANGELYVQWYHSPKDKNGFNLPKDA